MPPHHIAGLTKKELIEALRKYGANVGGNKAMLQDRLLKYEVQGNDTTSQTTQSVSAQAPTSSKATGAGARKTSSVRSVSAPLAKGNALQFVLCPDKEYHELTIRCLTTLQQACTANAIKDPSPGLTSQLRPLHDLCVALKQTAGNLDVSSSHASNVEKLRTVIQTAHSSHLTNISNLHVSVRNVLHGCLGDGGDPMVPDSTVDGPNNDLNGQTDGDLPGDGEAQANDTDLMPPPRTTLSIPSTNELEREVLRISDAISSFLRDWSATFPEPEIGEWPHDFSSQERSLLRKYINNVVEGTEADDKLEAVPVLLADDGFPILKGKNSGVIQAIIKEWLYEMDTHRKRKSSVLEE